MKGEGVGGSTGAGEDVALPYARPFWTEDEVEALADVVRSGWWTSGAKVDAFEQRLAAVVGARRVVSTSSGTAAIQGLLHAVGPPGEGLFVTSALNFVAGPAVARQAGYAVAFTDVDRRTLTMSPDSLARVLDAAAARTRRTVVMPVHFAGLPADMDAIVRLARQHAAVVIEDACHALPARYADGSAVGPHSGSLGAAFSFHPNKPVAAGEGGAIATDDDEVAARVRLFRNHYMRRPAPGGPDNAPWHYVVDEPGLNLRLSEFHAAVGLVQLGRLDESLARRRALARRYREELAPYDCFRYVPTDDRGRSGLHLFPVSFDLPRLGVNRNRVFAHYRRHGIAVQVHYVPLTEQPAFLQRGREGPHFPGVEHVAPGLLSLPMFFGMSDADQDRVLEATHELTAGRVRW